MTTTGRLRACFEQQDFAGLHELYSDEATLELHVGAAHRVYRGRRAIVARYSQDYSVPATFVRWDVRDTSWGAVVEAAAVQGHGAGMVFFRWVHLLAIENGRISTDTVYCTGAVPAATARDALSEGHAPHAVARRSASEPDREPSAGQVTDAARRIARPRHT